MHGTRRNISIFLSVPAVLIALNFGTASASAALPEKATDAVGAVVSSVTGTSPPSLPTTPVRPPDSAPPKAPVAVPSLPQASPGEAPTVTRPKSSDPARSSSSGSGRVSDPGLHLPSPDEVTGGANAVLGSSMEETDPTTPSARGGGVSGLGSREVQRFGVPAVKIESTRAASLGLLRAYVWPAIALGPVGELVGALLADGEYAASLAVPDASGLVGGLLGVAGTERAGGASNGTALSNLPSRDSRDIPLPSGGQLSLLFIIACAALMAWLVFALRREARSAHWHWPL